MLFVVLAVSTHVCIWFIHTYYSCMCQARLHANETIVRVQTKMHECSSCKPNMHARSSCKHNAHGNRITSHVYTRALTCIYTSSIFCAHAGYFAYIIRVESCSCYTSVQSSSN